MSSDRGDALTQLALANKGTLAKNCPKFYLYLFIWKFGHSINPCQIHSKSIIGNIDNFYIIQIQSFTC
jgi:hypothetical protein